MYTRTPVKSGKVEHRLQSIDSTCRIPFVTSGVTAGGLCEGYTALSALVLQLPVILRSIQHKMCFKKLIFDNVER